MSDESEFMDEVEFEQFLRRLREMDRRRGLASRRAERAARRRKARATIAERRAGAL